MCRGKAPIFGVTLKRNAIRVISSAAGKASSVGKRIAREIEKELSEL